MCLCWVFFHQLNLNGFLSTGGKLIYVVWRDDPDLTLKWSYIVSAYRTKPGCFQKLFNWSVTLCFCRGAFSNLHHINLTCPPVLNWGHMRHLFMTAMTNMHQNRLDRGLLFIGCGLRVTHLINIKFQIRLAYKEFQDYKA